MSRDKASIIVVTGGVISSLGKGLTASSLALLLKARGLKVRLMKMDPYLNVDPGTMSPFQHGEVFVTDDGAETDLDLGHYERFINQDLNQKQNITAGRIYERVINKERQGEYLGGTVQVIPHITNEIKKHIVDVARGTDILLVEIGGTVGDIESLPFLEAVRQLNFDLGRDRLCYLHVTLVPYIKAAGELKTKPTQHSVQELRRIGIQPDILVCRADCALEKDIKSKIALFANLKAQEVISAPDVPSIYQLPLVLQKEGLDSQVCRKLKYKTPKPDISRWKEFLRRLSGNSTEVKVGVVGKYVDLTESYKSINEALIHAAAHNQVDLKVSYIDSEKLEQGVYQDIEKRKKILGDVDALLVPGGFGERGVEGKIRAIEYARENLLPYFGICLGMQLMSLEFARNVLKIKNANSEEFVSTSRSSKKNVIHYLPGQEKADKGGTMRLGAYPCRLKKGSLAYKAYRRAEVSERHRHRLEFNNAFKQQFIKAGMDVSGVYKEKNLVEILEVKNHPWFLGCQFHPEFKSRPEKAHPLFVGFIGAAAKLKKKKK